MQTLRMLGSIGLTGSDGVEVDALLRQPKSVALLAYLAMPRPGAWHRRDVLLATFWPELSQSRARAALRSALHLLRRHLDDDTIRTRGDDEVALDSARLATDVAAMLDDVAAHAHDRAVARYAGAFLPGLYITDAPEFERWLERERTRLNETVVRAAAALIDQRETAGDLPGAIEAARRASELSPDDEGVMRRHVALLDRIGDRVGALAVFERFRARISQEFGTDPSAATLALIDDLRTRTTSRAARVSSPMPHAAETVAGVTPAAGPPIAEPRASAAAVGPTTVAMPEEPAPRASRRSLVALSFAAATFLAATYAARHRASATDVDPGTSHPARLVILPFETERTDSAQRYLATGLRVGVSRRLERLGGLAIRTGPPAVWPASPLPDTTALGRLGTTIVLRVALSSAGDSLDVNASLADSASRAVRAVLSRRFAPHEIPEVESEIAAGVAGRIQRLATPFDPHPARRSVDPESYRLTVLGFHQLLALRDPSAAIASFTRATELDPLNARAWSGISSVWATRTTTDQLPASEGLALVTAAAERAVAIDSTEGTALANLGIARALERRDLSAGMPLIRRAMMYEPSNAEIYLIAGFLERHAHRWDESRDYIRLARQLDPLTPRYGEAEGGLEMCAGRPVASEQVYRRSLEERPTSADARAGLVRALAAQRRYDEALDAWRLGIDGSTPDAVVAALRGAHGRDGYLAAWHADGKNKLAKLLHTTAGERVPPLRLMDFQFRSGDTASAFATLEASWRAREPWAYRLPCLAALDEVRDTPHYRALIARIGEMAAH